MAAFPSLPVFETFDRASLGQYWTMTGTGNTAIASNQLRGSTTANDNILRWTWGLFGPAVEFYFDAVTLTADQAFSAAWRLDNGALNYYCLNYQQGGANNELARGDGGVETRLGAALDTTLYADGDSIGVRHIGPLIELWKKTGGVWSPVTTREDATYQIGGEFSYYFGSTAGGSNVFDNLGGGSLSLAPLFFPRQQVARGRVWDAVPVGMTPPVN